MLLAGVQRRIHLVHEALGGAARLHARAVVDEVPDVDPLGELLQFTYGPASPVSPGMRELLGIEGKREEWVLTNLPPAAVWRYRRIPVQEVRAA